MSRHQSSHRDESCATSHARHTEPSAYTSRDRFLLPAINTYAYQSWPQQCAKLCWSLPRRQKHAYDVLFSIEKPPPTVRLFLTDPPCREIEAFVQIGHHRKDGRFESRGRTVRVTREAGVQMADVAEAVLASPSGSFPFAPYKAQTQFQTLGAR
jgi:hypothetical protein